MFEIMAQVMIVAMVQKRDDCWYETENDLQSSYFGSPILLTHPSSLLH